MNETTIKRALRKGEKVTLECKKAMTEVPKSLWETYSAFANTIGGLILLGVNEHRNETVMAKRYEIVGVEDAQKILADFWNTINSDKVNANILTNSDVEVQTDCLHPCAYGRLEGKTHLLERQRLQRDIQAQP